MATQRLAKVVITANATTAKKVLEEIDALVEKYTADIQKMTAAGQANTAECKRAESTLKALSQVQRDNIEDTKRLGQVVQDLTNTKLRDLRRALGSGKSALAKLTGSDADLKKAEQIRAEMKQVGDAIRLIEGQYVKIADGLKNVKNQSDQWLDKAIKQQRDLVGSLQKSDASYQQNLTTLKQLEAEEDRRKGKMSLQEAQATVNNKDASASELRRAKATLTETRETTPTSNTSQIGSINKDLQEIDKRLEAVSGKAEKATISWREMKRVMAEPSKASGEDIKRTMEAIQQRIQKLPAGSKAVANLRAEYAKLEQTLKGTNMSQKQLNDILLRSKSGKASLDELRRAYKQLEEELNHINTKSREFADKQKAMKDLKKNIDEVTGAAKKQGGAWNTALKNLTAYVGMFAVFNQVKSIMTGVIKKNLEYSGSLTDIRKVAGLTQEDINELSSKLAKIDTRTSVEGLAKLAYEGSKLGMSKYGIDGMNSFVKAADQINVAIGEEMGEEALPALSKMVEVMGLIPRMGIEKAMLATGSAMFKLSTTSTATSNDIVEFAKRLTGVARTAGITTDQLLALGSASSSMMLMPEVASTAMGKFIVALQKNHNLIAKELGIPDETIKNLYASGRAMDAIVLVLEKMKEKGNMNALGGIFKDLGSDGQRLVTAMVTMSKNVDMLKEHLDTSNDAFHEATAVTAEYEMQQESAIGILERANNLWSKAFVNPDGVDNVKELSKAWYDMSKFLTENAFALNSMKTVLAIIITSCQTLVYILPALMAGLLFKGVSSAILGIRTALMGAADTAFLATIRTEGLRAAWSKLNITMKSNWISLLIGLLVELGIALTHVFSRQKDVAEGQLDINKYVREGAAEYDKERRKIDSYISALNNANTSAKQRERIIKNFNREYKPYLDKLGLEVNSVETLKSAYAKLNAELRKKMFYQIKQKAYDAELGKAEGDVGKAVMDYSKYINSEKGATWAAYDTKWVQDQINKGLGAKTIYRSMVESVYGKSGIWSGYDGSYILKNGSVKDDRLYGYLQNLVSSQRNYNKTKKTIDDALDPLIGDYNPYAVESPGTLENDAPDKEAIRQQKREERERARDLRQEKLERERAWREELKQKQDEANAIMDNVRNFYERQINAKMEEAIGLGMDKTEQELFVEPVRQRMNEALEQVRLAIAGQANIWEQFKQTMNKDLIEKTDETGINLSEGLLKDITDNNIDALRKKLDELGNSLGLPLNSILAEVFAKASKNAQANLALQFKQQEARRKAIQEHNYTGIVQQNMYDTFNTLGYANPTEAEIADKKSFDKRKANIIAMYEKARKEIVSLYKIDVDTKEGQGALLQFLFGDDPDGMAKRISEVLGNDANEWQAFYNKLIQYSDEYTAAEKKNYDEAKKITDQMWAVNKRNLDQQEKLRKIQNESKMFGNRTNFLSNLGLADLTADPEIELMKARMQAAEDYYAFIQANTQNQQLIDEAERARREAELSYVNQVATAMKSRLSQMKELVQPIEDFGAAVGQALAEMRYDAESANDAIKSALKSMLESWAKMALNDVNTQMWKAINDAEAKRAQKKVQPDIDAARANANTNANNFAPDFTNIGTENNPVWVRIVGDHYENANGERVGAPRAWRKRNGDSTEDDRDGFAQYVGQVGADVAGITNTASQTGSAIADVTVGGTSLSDAAAGFGGSLVGDLMNTNFKVDGSSKNSDKEKKKQVQKEKKHQKELTVEVKKGAKEREKVTNVGVDNITDITEQGNKEQSKGTEVAQQTIVNATDAALNATLTAKQKNNDETLQSDAARTQGEVTFSIAGAMAKCFEFLGPIAGPIAAAVVMSTLMGLLQWALSSALGGGKNKNSSANTKNTKVVSGMLTYDSGNVQDLRPFVGNDGSLYWAAEDSKPHDGVSLLTRPTATTINGQPSLVAENGPELVIGRETTQAMMMNNPQLLKALVNYDRNYSGRRAYDNGNIAETSPTIAAGTPASEESAIAQADTNIVLLQAVNTLLQRLEQPIEAKIDMYGRGKLYDSMTKANQFMKNK